MANKKLRFFKASDVANKKGASLLSDGSIMPRSSALGSTSHMTGQTRSQYGISKKKPVYNYGYESPKLRGAVAHKSKKKSPTKRKKK